MPMPFSGDLYVMVAVFRGTQTDANRMMAFCRMMGKLFSFHISTEVWQNGGLERFAFALQYAMGVQYVFGTAQYSRSILSKLLPKLN